MYIHILIVYAFACSLSLWVADPKGRSPKPYEPVQRIKESL